MPEPDTTPAATLRQRVTDALAAAVTLPGATPNDEEQVVLDDLADAVLPLFGAEPDAHPPIHRWRVEHVDGTDWVPGSGLKADRGEAVHLLNVGNEIRPLWADGTPVQRRLVRETTSYTVEDTPTPPAAQDRGGL